jgi:hypothetical protein
MPNQHCLLDQVPHDFVFCKIEGRLAKIIFEKGVGFGAKELPNYGKIPSLNGSEKRSLMGFISGVYVSSV